jgi:hypothetical protein
MRRKLGIEHPSTVRELRQVEITAPVDLQQNGSSIRQHDVPGLGLDIRQQRARIPRQVE